MRMVLFLEYFVEVLVTLQKTELRSLPRRLAPEFRSGRARGKPDNQERLPGPSKYQGGKRSEPNVPQVMDRISEP